MTAVAAQGATRTAPLRSRVAGAWSAWWCPALPVRRVAVLRTVVYLFVPFDLFVLVNDIVPHAYGPASLYRPLRIARLLHLPAPVPWYAQTLRAVLIAAALVAATGRLRRLAGWTVAAGYLHWIVIGFSYGKVDHDHLGFVVALFVLPLVATRGARGDSGEAAGWTLRWIQVAAICTYFLSAFAKLRYGGWGWAGSATFYWALTRRGTALGSRLLDHPGVLVPAQWGLLAMELLTPVVLFLRGLPRWVALGVLLSFHVVTYLAIEIHFLPTVLCLLAFLPLERLPSLRKG